MNRRKILRCLALGTICVPTAGFLSACGGGGGEAAAAPPATSAPTPVAPLPVAPVGSNVTLLDGVDGPAFLAAYDPGNKATWVVSRGYRTNDGTGSFYQFQAPNHAGTMLGGVTFNGGLVDGTPGLEQGDLDVIFMLDGKPANISFIGRYQGNEPGLMCWPPDVLAIGTAVNRYASLYLTVYPPRPGMPPNAIGSVKVSGGYAALYA